MFGLRLRLLSSSTISLCIAAITHTYLLFHCYPYLGYMSVTLLQNKDNCTVDDAGLYTGLLGTAFTLGRCLSFVPWKIARHTHTHNNNNGIGVVGGIKNTLLLSLLLSSICSIWFGVSQSFISALLARFCLGLSNTISGCVKRGAINNEKQSALKRHNATTIQIVSLKEKYKIENSDIKREELAPSKVLAVMHWGSCIGPFVGGLLSQSGTYSQTTILPELFDIHYPFLLPNAVGALLCVISMIAVQKYFIEEDDIKPESTHNNSKFPSSTIKKDDDNEESPDEANETRPLLKKVSLSKQQSQDASITKIKNVWKSTNTRNHLLAYFSFSFVVVCIDEGLPLFLIARLAGPGLSPKQIGYILGTAGLINVLCQSIKIRRLLGDDDDSDDTYYPTLKWTSILGNIPSILFPLVLVFNGGTYYYTTVLDSKEEEEETVLDDESLGPSGKLSWLGFVFLVLLVGFMKSMDSIYFSLIGVATGRTVPSNYKDQVARIMTLGALYARAVAPVISGLLVSIFMSSEFMYEGTSAVLLWIVIGLLFGSLAAGYSFSLIKAGGILVMGSFKNNRSGGSSSTESDIDGTNSSSLITSKTKRKNLSNSQLMYLNNRQRAQIYVKLWEVQYDKDSNTVASKWRRLTRKAIAYNRITKKSKTEGEQQKDTAEEATNLKKRPSWVDHILQPGLDIENPTFLILGTHKDDKSCLPHVLTPPMMIALQAELPFVCHEDNFWLKYSLVRDGAFVHMLESKIELSKNTIIAIETLEGDVFGCFMANPWKKNNKYEVCGQSFLWRMKHKRENPTLTGDSNNDEALLDEIAWKEGDIEVFKYSGNGDQCQLFSDDRIAAGGGIVDGSDGFGFLVEDNLSRGTTSPCATYGNPILLVGNDNNIGLPYGNDNIDDPSTLSLGGGGGEAKTNLGRFEVANMEVWCMTPFIDVEEAEQSEMTLRFIKGNTKGDAPSSGQSAWTNFL